MPVSPMQHCVRTILRFCRIQLFVFPFASRKSTLFLKKLSNNGKKPSKEVGLASTWTFGQNLRFLMRFIPIGRKRGRVPLIRIAHGRGTNPEAITVTREENCRRRGVAFVDAGISMMVASVTAIPNCSCLLLLRGRTLLSSSAAKVTNTTGPNRTVIHFAFPIAV